MTELGVETRSRYFHPGVEDLAVNLYYMYSFVPSGFVAGLLGYHSFEGRSDSKHEGDAQFQPIIRIFPSKDPATGEIYNLRDAKASDAIYTQPQGTNSKFTLGDILTHANVSLDEKWSAEVDSRDARRCSARQASTCRCRCPRAAVRPCHRCARSDLSTSLSRTSLGGRRRAG